MDYVVRTINGITLKAEPVPIAIGIGRSNVFWVQQNPYKSSEWAQLARKGHQVFHLMLGTEVAPGEVQVLGYLNKVRIDDQVLTYDEARDIFKL